MQDQFNGPSLNELKKKQNKTKIFSLWRHLFKDELNLLLVTNYAFLVSGFDWSFSLSSHLSCSRPSFRSTKNVLSATYMTRKLNQAIRVAPKSNINFSNNYNCKLEQKTTFDFAGSCCFEVLTRLECSFVKARFSGQIIKATSSDNFK